MDNKKPVLFTIGHSTHSIEHFVELLNLHSIKAIVDVRSSPYSQYNPQFNRENFEQKLKSQGIYYVFLGKELGARREESNCYKGNKVIFSLVAETELFIRGLDRLEEGAKKMRVAVMCAEKDPLTCHRTLLVTYYARNRFADVCHILENGDIESLEHADNRLLLENKLDADDLFNSREERLKLAYEKRGDKISYEENEAKTNYG